MEQTTHDHRWKETARVMIPAGRPKDTHGINHAVAMLMVERTAVHLKCEVCGIPSYVALEGWAGHGVFQSSPRVSLLVEDVDWLGKCEAAVRSVIKLVSTEKERTPAWLRPEMRIRLSDLMAALEGVHVA